MAKMNVVYMNINKIKPYENNPRIHTKEQIQALAKSIKMLGFKQSIVIDKDGVIIAGHGRYYAARELGLKEVPCTDASDLTEEQIKLYRLIDNKIAEKSEWNDTLLKLELEELKQQNEELWNSCIDDFDFTMPNVEALDLDKDNSNVQQHKVYCCPKCGFEFEV